MSFTRHGHDGVLAAVEVGKFILTCLPMLSRRTHSDRESLRRVSGRWLPRYLHCETSQFDPALSTVLGHYEEAVIYFPQSAFS